MGRIYDSDPYVFGKPANKLQYVDKFGQPTSLTELENHRKSALFNYLKGVLFNNNEPAYDLFGLEEFNNSYLPELEVLLNGKYRIIKSGARGSKVIRDSNGISYQPYDNDFEQLVTLVRADLNIADKTEYYQKLYMEWGNYNENRGFGYPSRMHVLELGGIVFAHIHAPGIPTGNIQENWYATLASFLQNYQNVVVIGDFNVDDNRFLKWMGVGGWFATPVYTKASNDNFKSSYHKYIIDGNITYEKQGEDLYNKVDHIVYKGSVNISDYNKIGPSNTDRPPAIYSVKPPTACKDQKNIMWNGKNVILKNKDCITTVQRNDTDWVSDHLGQSATVSVQSPRKKIRMTGTTFTPKSSTFTIGGYENVALLYLVIMAVVIIIVVYYLGQSAMSNVYPNEPKSELFYY